MRSLVLERGADEVGEICGDQVTLALVPITFSYRTNTMTTLSRGVTVVNRGRTKN